MEKRKDPILLVLTSDSLTLDNIDDSACLRLRGTVRLDNYGGFIQAALDLGGTDAADASGYRGVTLEVYGNNEEYNLHLRTADVWLPWQSYRTSFQAPARWHTVQLPFSGFSGYRIGKPLDLKHLQRIGIVAIGRAFEADLCIARLGLYRDTP
jgi:hypothetical protein